MPMTKKKRQLKRAKMKYFKNYKKNNNVDEVSNKDTMTDEIKSEAGSPLTPKKVYNYATELNATPVRKRRTNKEKSIANESMNITNLNILFDSEFIYNARSGNDVYISKNNSARKRSLSSVPKFSTPIQGEPYRKHKHTQTPKKNEMVLHRYNTNEETPKCRKIFSMQKTSLENSPIIKNNFLTKKFQNDINFNPYLKNVDPKETDDTYSEASFFCPNLFQPYSSTPIQAVVNHRDLVENLAEAILSPKTPKFGTNVNINKSPKEKTLKKEITIKSLKSHTFNISTTQNKSVKSSPNKSLKRTNSTKLNGSFSKYDIGRKSSVELSLNKTDTGCYDNLLSRLRKYCKFTQNWTGKIVNVCFYLGLHLKNTVSSIYAGHNNSLQEGIGLSCNRCEQYQAEVRKLSLKVDDMENVNKKLAEEMQKIRDEFRQIINVKIEIEQLKDELKTIKNRPYVPTITPLPPPPPPMPPMSPPPPPPPPLPPLTGINSNKFMISKKQSNGGEDKENSRPVISLDAILNVKLKKPKPYQPTPTSRRETQPVVSLDMLRQVKLKPSSSRSVLIPDYETPEVTSSPNTNLCRLLKSDMSPGENSAKGETDLVKVEKGDVQD